ncbi:O-antigen ligase family protein [Phenylobacterium sp.]|jgi:O-antigen ligase|uniref:O-antigen ligase family protein n=1 Tax=Phenylobacterium sp. TaxID=1871053 RepID=UPI002F95ECDB
MIKRTDPSDDGPRVSWRQDDGWLAIASVALIFAGFALYGAMRPQTALIFTLLWALLAGVCLVRPRLRDAALRPAGLGGPALLFAVVVGAALWSLTPWVPGGPHPSWAYLEISPGAGTINKSATLIEILKLVGLGCVFLVGLAAGASDNRARLALNMILGVGAPYALWAFFAFVVGRGPGESRLEASFLSANTAGTIFAALFVLSAGPIVRTLRSEDRGRLTGAAPYGIAALLFLGCLFMTASRGGFVAALCGLAVFAVLQVMAGRARWSRALAGSAAAALLILAFLAFGGDYLITRLLGASRNVAERADIARIHWAAVQDAPLLGYGLGTFDDLNRMLLSAGNFDHLWNIRAAHNIYLSWLEQAGMVGGLSMFACIGLLLWNTVRATVQRTRTTNLLFALVGVDVVFLAHGVTDFALEMFSVAAFWSFLLGLQFSLAQGRSRR